VFFSSTSLFAQLPSSSPEIQLIQGTFLGKTPPVIEFATEFDHSSVDSTQVFEIKNFKERYRKSPVERNLFPQMDPLWKPENAQQTQRTPQGELLSNFNGMGYSGVQPPDPCVAASDDYVVQMINGSGGAKYRVWNKNGTAISASLNFDNLFAGYNGLGDPIVLFDQLANRWFLSEFTSSGNRLLLAVSETDNPLGSFYTYVFQAQSFPDYPKYSVWPDAYYCTSNENTSTLYAFERDSMLVGAPANMIRLTATNLSGYGFQALAPVSFEGTNVGNAPATFWRHVDDEAHSPGNSNAFSDFVQYFELIPNFAVPTNSVFNGPISIPVSEFDSDINGYFAFSGISQKNSSVSLDPIREVFMNRMNYRNFGYFESIVGCHVTDVNGNDWAGIRWYEFRKTDTTDWAMYQEGTFAPNSENRWMGAININEDGTICLAYSIAGSNTFPSLAYTGRNMHDPLGTMTISEQIIVNGGGANTSNRYGDYAALAVDPANDSTFWFTSEYNPTSTWNTRIAHIRLTDPCNGLRTQAIASGSNVCPEDSLSAITLQSFGGPTSTYSYSLDNINFQSSPVFSNLPSGNYIVYTQNGTCTATSEVNLSLVPEIVGSPSVTDILCFGDSNGEIDVSVSGGTSPYELSLDSQMWNPSTTFSNLSAGVYSVYIRDANNCIQKVDSVVVSEPLVVSSTDSIVPASDSLSADGEIYIFASGGTPPYKFSLDSLNFYPNSVFSNLSAGSYTYYILDSNNCSFTGKSDVRVTSVKNIEFGEGIQVYPNPVGQNLFIQFDRNWAASEVNVTISAANGSTVFSAQYGTLSFPNKLDINVNKLSTGIYFLKIQVGEELILRQLIKE
jgi:hypothetical protein